MSTRGCEQAEWSPCTFIMAWSLYSFVLAFKTTSALMVAIIVFFHLVHFVLRFYYTIKMLGFVFVAENLHYYN